MKLNTYQKTAITTVIATLFLILVGGLVRSTGSGMGCPDWPKCFGQWVPPSNENQLPANYKEIYSKKRQEKNLKVARYFEVLGFAELADKIKHDPEILRERDFNPTKTKIEYVNRLVGVAIGILIFLTFIFSFRYWKMQRHITVLSFIAFILVGFQGWLGSIVVSTNLLPWMITVHMILALVIVNILLYAAFKATSEFVTVQLNEVLRRKLFIAASVLLVLTMVQLVLGTQVREVIDIIKEGVTVPARSTWLDKAGETFLIHRSYSWAILMGGIYIAWVVWREQLKGVIAWVGYTNFALILLQIFVGIGLEHLNVPPAFQVIHLVGISLIVCTQFLLILVIRLRTK